jgi:hypothetical protein
LGISDEDGVCGGVKLLRLNNVAWCVREACWTHQKGLLRKTNELEACSRISGAGLLELEHAVEGKGRQR